MMARVALDGYGRPSLVYRPMDSYPPYGPSTPHSFHDSQSPVHPDENAIYGPYPPRAPRSGGAMPSDDHPQNPHRRMFGPPEFPRMPQIWPFRQ